MVVGSLAGLVALFAAVLFFSCAASLSPRAASEMTNMPMTKPNTVSLLVRIKTPTVVLASPRAATFQWNADSLSQRPFWVYLASMDNVSEFRVRYRLKDGALTNQVSIVPPVMSATIRLLRPKTRYIFSVVAVDNAGVEGESSRVIVFRTPQR